MLAFLLCDGSILEEGHRSTCFRPNVNTVHWFWWRRIKTTLNRHNANESMQSDNLPPLFMNWPLVIVINVCLFIAQVFPQRTLHTQQDVAIRAILASGCRTQQVIPWRACTTNCPATTTTTWQHSCHTTRSSSAGFTMYTPCICELAPATMHSTNEN